ncbi:MAG TPA: emopamil-binding family protein [Ktedonobacterales bacterium]|nr:emopamil-binding family protein [Ktedonobacterales bacterium]
MAAESSTATRAVKGAAGRAERRPIPLARRRYDLIFVAFFLVNLCFITYIVDLEQLVIANPAHFTYPLWPPGPLVDLVHWWGRTFDPVLLARPVWWKATIWVDAVLYGPFYAAAIYAFLRAKDWIRTPALVWAGMMLMGVTVILFEERAGPYATPQFGMVLAANLPWLLLPLAVIARMARAEHPFTEVASDA